MPPNLFKMNLLSFTSTLNFRYTKASPFLLGVFLRCVWHGEAFCIIAGIGVSGGHRLNIELDLLSLFGLHVHSCTHWLRTPPPPAFGLIYGGPIGQPR